MQLSRRSPLYPHGSSYVELHDGYPTWGDKSDVVFTPRSKYFSYVRSSSTTPLGNSTYRLALKNLRWKRRRTSKIYCLLKLKMYREEFFTFSIRLITMIWESLQLGILSVYQALKNTEFIHALQGRRGIILMEFATITRAEKFDQN